MAAAVPIFTMISTAVSVVGALRQGKSQQQAAGYNAAVADRNAEVARQQSRQEAAQIDRRNRLRIGAARASVGASGGTAEGSAIDVLGDMVAQGELERQQALYQGELRAMGFQDTASLERARGRDARSAARTRAGTALLSGAGQAYSQYSDLSGGTGGGSSGSYNARMGPSLRWEG